MSDFITTDHVRISYEYTKGKQPVILIHGWMQNSTIWDAIQNELDNTYSVLTVDLRGHGKSEERDDVSYEVARITKDVQELIEELNIKKPILIGHSLGGMIAQGLMTEISVKKAVLIDTAARNPMINGARDFFERTKELVNTAKQEIQTLPIVKQTKPKAMYECLKGIEKFDIRKAISDNNTPTCIIVGEKDAVTPKTYSQELHTLLPNSEVHTIPQAGHNPHITHTKQVQEILNKYL